MIILRLGNNLGEPINTSRTYAKPLSVVQLSAA